jgi:hypothetical protein
MVAEAAVLLLFFTNTNGPAMLRFDSLAQCTAAEPVIVRNYREMTGATPLSRCVALSPPKGEGR